MKKTDIAVIIGFIIFELIVLLVMAKLIEKKTKLLVEQKNKLLALEGRDESLVKLQKDFGLVEKYIGLINQTLPNKEGIIDLLGQIEKEASRAGIKAKINFTNNSAVKEAKNLKSVSFSLLLSGSYFQLVDFIKKIENLPQIIVIKRVSVQSPKGINNQTKAILTIKCYTDPKF